MKFPPIKEQMDLLSRGVEKLVSPEELEAKLVRSEKSGQPLKVKLGADPSRPDLHIGHAVVLRKLRQFQDLGHHAILIIGDFTAAIGDPTGRNKTRPHISLQDAQGYGESYVEQATLVLDGKDLEVVHNSTWLSQMTFREVIELSAQYTVAQMLERDDFSKRYKNGVPISIHEFLYPLAQAQDSVALNVDVELGGTDQLFNLLVGRELQRQAGQDPQIILTMPLLEGTDGKEKMSKSMDNYVGLTEAPDQMYGKILSIPDDLIVKYFLLATDVAPQRISQIEAEMKTGANPRDFKRELARALVSLYHDENAAVEAETTFDKLFIKKQIPDEMPTYELAADRSDRTIVDILTAANILDSRSEVRRMIKQNAVSVNAEKIEDEHFQFDTGMEYTVKVGKRKFLRVVCTV